MSFLIRSFVIEMNYLSHYYFDLQSDDPELILGGLLPDLVHGFHKKPVLKPVRHTGALMLQQHTASLLRGWNRHKAIDKYFHNASFFHDQTAYLKQGIKKIFINTGPYTFFMAHILLELCLDGLLLESGKVSAGKLYESLSKVEASSIEDFFTQAEGDDPAGFYLYLQNFIMQGYLRSYTKPEGIIYALDRICQRLWKTRFTEAQNTALYELAANYMATLKPGFITIYQEIEKSGLP